MKRITSLLLLAVTTLTLPLSALAQEAAGRVLVAVGEVSIVRGNQQIPARSGTEVRTGDTVQLGASSNAQVRFTDESIVALRPNTTFRIDQYQFGGGLAASAEKALFSLLKGGLRTVTGVIGRRNQNDYGVTTTTATVGIRGTHYVLLSCDNSCLNPDGSIAPNGTYGSVTNGRIAVINQTGETQFGADSYFRVADTKSLPTRLLTPPGFLQDVLEGRARQSRSQLATTPQPGAQQQPSADPVQVAALGGTTSGYLSPLAQTGADGSTSGDSRVSTIASVLAAPTVLATNQFQATNQISTAGPASVITPGFTGTVFYRVNGPFNIPSSCTSPPCDVFTAGNIFVGVNLALQRATVSTVLLATNGTMYNLSTPLNTDGLPITISGNQVIFGGTLSRTDPRFVEQTGSFRCSNCSPSGFVDTISINGTISNGVASLVLGATDGSISVSLPQATPPNNLGAAIVIQTCTANCTTANPTTAGASAASTTYWNVAINGSGQLTRYGAQDSGGTGPANAVTNSVGRLTGFVNTASNQTVGSDAAAGNLIWGTWTGPGARLTDTNYTAYTSGNNQRQPWIVGDLTNTVPATLGTQTYTLISTTAGLAAAFSGTTQSINSASLAADFVNRSMTLSVSVNNSNGSTNPALRNTFQSTGSSGISPINSRFSAGFSTTTCTGPCNSGVGTADGSFSGFFTGPQAQGAAAAITIGFGASANPSTGGGVSAVIGLKR